MRSCVTPNARYMDIPPNGGLTAHGSSAKANRRLPDSMPFGRPASCPRAQDTCLTVHSRAYFPGFLGVTSLKAKNKEAQ